MDELIPKQPFFERHEFLGSLVQDDKSADDLQIVVQFSLLKEGEIAGQVLGTSETFDKLARISDITGPKLILRSKKDPDSRFEFYSEDIHLGSSQRRTWTPAYGNNLAYVVSELIFDKFEIIHHIEPRDTPLRRVVFSLSGPQYMWEIFSLGERSFTGETKVDIRNTKIDLDVVLPFSIEVKPWYFYDKSSLPDVFDLTTHILSLEFTTSILEEEFSNDAFVQKAIAVAEDLILLISFMSRSWITWYSYKLLTPTFIKRHVRRAREVSTRSINHLDTLIKHGQGRQFLKSAYTNLQKLRSEGIDLFMSIAYYLSGLESKYMEEQFTTLFLALERTKDLFAQRNQEYVSILLPHLIEPLSDSIKDQIRRFVDSPDIRGRIYDKIRELNRPSLRFVLDSLLSENNISYSDLYPDSEEFSLISTRDQLFHSSKKVDYDHLFREHHRLKSILERLLLHLLGWNNYDRSPDIYTKKMLHETKKSRGNNT